MNLEKLFPTANVFRLFHRHRGDLLTIPDLCRIAKRDATADARAEMVLPLVRLLEAGKIEEEWVGAGSTAVRGYRWPLPKETPEDESDPQRH